jgi:aryl-alcohol dehydrogenase-like predicted oxidoreductase
MIRFACEQAPYSIFTRHIELDVLELASRYGMGVMAWSPLAGGWLTGKYRRGEEAPARSRMERSRVRGGRVADRFDLSRPEAQRKLDLVEDLLPIADKAGMALTHMALAFILAHPSLTSAIIGPRTLDQLEDILHGAELRLDEATLDAIDDTVPPGSVVDDADRGLEPEARRRFQTPA